jgi:hypothetical protein
MWQTEASMGLIIKFVGTKRTAFARGFMRGLAAPAVLFSSHAAPALPEVAQVVPPLRPCGDAGALASDWERVAGGLTAAVQKHHGQTKAEFSPKSHA